MSDFKLNIVYTCLFVKIINGHEYCLKIDMKVLKSKDKIK